MPSLNYSMVQILVTVVVGLALVRIVDLAVTAAFKKMTGQEFVTKDEHRLCQSTDNGDIKDLKSEVKVIKQVVLRIAVKNGINENDLDKLID